MATIAKQIKLIRFIEQSLDSDRETLILSEKYASNATLSLQIRSLTLYLLVITEPSSHKKTLSGENWRSSDLNIGRFGRSAAVTVTIGSHDVSDFFASLLRL